MKISATFFTFSIIFSAQSHAECTYKEAQEKLMQVGNILQQYNQQKNELIDNGRPIPAELDRKLGLIAIAAAENGQALGEVENINTATNETVVPNEICTNYNQIISKYRPDNYEVKAIKHSAETPFHCAGEEEAETWDRYSKIMSATSDISKEASNKVTNLLTEFGEKMTYDFPAACNLLAEAEQIINQ